MLTNNTFVPSGALHFESCTTASIFFYDLCRWQSRKDGVLLGVPSPQCVPSLIAFLWLIPLFAHSDLIIFWQNAGSECACLMRKALHNRVPEAHDEAHVCDMRLHPRLQHQDRPLPVILADSSDDRQVLATPWTSKHIPSLLQIYLPPHYEVWLVRSRKSHCCHLKSASHWHHQTAWKHLGDIPVISCPLSGGAIIRHMNVAIQCTRQSSNRMQRVNAQL